MKISDSRIDAGKAFDWGKVSREYVVLLPWDFDKNDKLLKEDGTNTIK